MSSASKLTMVLVVIVAALVATLVAEREAPPRTVVHLVAPAMTVREISSDLGALRVCADPNNLPFSNEHGDGFENAIADLVARDLHKTLSYYWLPQRRGFVRNSLRAGVCDAIIGVPAHYEQVRTTRPYYRSTYVFLSRPGLGPPRSLDDPALRRLRIGIQITGDDYENPPAAAALAARDLAGNVRGYTVYGDYSQPDPQRVVFDDLSAGRIDTAIVWGPTAGYHLRHGHPGVQMAAVAPQRDAAAGPFSFSIAMGVRQDDVVLQQSLDDVIARRSRDIERILRRFGVPLVATGAGT